MTHLAFPTIAVAAAVLCLTGAAKAEDTHTIGVNISDSDTASADLFVSDNTSLSGFLCVGQACTDNENFTNLPETPALKISDPTPHISFNDTTGGANDWAIVINPIGLSLFAIEDFTNGAHPFTVLSGGASDGALVIDGNGKIGYGTYFPQRELHVVDGDSPALRLEQDSSGALTPIAWDLIGDEQGIYFQEVNSVKTPLIIKPDSPTFALTIAGTTGNIGLGTFTPDASLHVTRSDGTARIHVQDASTTQAVREMFLMENNGGSYFTMKNTQSGRDWFFNHENAAAGRFIITSSTNPSQGLFLSPNGNLQIGGVLTQNSDKNAKMAIEPVDPGEILAKLTTLPVSAWTYIDDESGARHVGPMAQDFHALFGLGDSATGISTLDTSGVALAAIQALNAEDKARTALIAELASENAALKVELAARDADLAVENAELKAMVASLAVRGADQRALIADLAERLQKLEGAHD